MVEKKGSDFDVKLIDLGLGMELDNKKQLSACGTPIFMPPEMWRDIENDVDKNDMAEEIKDVGDWLQNQSEGTKNEIKMSAQIKNLRQADCKCDIWSFGVTMHILMTGNSPFKPSDIP